ncbi:glycoside hydrolase family 16 protein [Amanita muscaria]
MGSTLLFTLIVNLFIAAEASYYPLREYAGNTFFDAWTFTNDYDRNNTGRVIWVDRPTAMANNLTSINSAGHAVIKVDTQQVVPNGPNPTRNSVRLVSNDMYSFGNLIIIDVHHLPYGCSVWPAFWTSGPNWPNDGEIDIIEGVNLMTSNNYALHTTSGCTVSAGGNMTGTLTNTNCLSTYTNDQGCSILETNPNSFGGAFSNANGGVWATQIDVSGVYMWFWSRKDVPSSITSATSRSPINIDGSWGTPSAAFPNTTCNFPQCFQPQQLILSTNICGDWAGIPSIYGAPNANNQTCQPPLAQAVCEDNVLGAGSPTYDNAYWEVSYIRTYVAASSQPGAPGSSTAGGNRTTAAGQPTGSAKNSASRGWGHDSSESAWSFTAALVLFGLL